MAYLPKPPESYQGNQVIINSDRLVFNAKTDSILLFSDKAIGFSTKGSFHFDTSPKDILDVDGEESKLIVNSPNIYLGLDDGVFPTEPAVLGDELGEFLDELLDLLKDMIDVITDEVSYTVTSAPGITGMNVKNIIAGLPERTDLTNRQKQMFHGGDNKYKLLVPDAPGSKVIFRNNRLYIGKFDKENRITSLEQYRELGGNYGYLKSLGYVWNNDTKRFTYTEPSDWNNPLSSVESR